MTELGKIHIVTISQIINLGKFTQPVVEFSKYRTGFVSLDRVLRNRII